MDLLKRNQAPISEEAWVEIDSTAKEAIKSFLTTRRVLSVDGPKGINFTAVNEGRLEKIDGQKMGEVSAGQYIVHPLVEARVSFELSKWELDNILRGAKDIELDALEEASQKLALFEENLVYNGYKPAGIKGTFESAKTV